MENLSPALVNLIHAIARELARQQLQNTQDNQ